MENTLGYLRNSCELEAWYSSLRTLASEQYQLEISLKNRELPNFFLSPESFGGGL